MTEIQAEALAETLKPGKREPRPKSKKDDDGL